MPKKIKITREAFLAMQELSDRISNMPMIIPPDKLVGEITLSDEVVTKLDKLKAESGKSYNNIIIELCKAKKGQR